MTRRSIAVAFAALGVVAILAALGAQGQRTLAGEVPLPTETATATPTVTATATSTATPTATATATTIPATATATATPAATEAPQALPPSGSELAAGSGFPWAVIAALGLGGLILLGGAALLRRTR